MKVTVELFGPARMRAGASRVTAQLPERASAADLVSALAKGYPKLVGDVIKQDGGSLVEPYALYLDGTGLLRDPATRLDDGACIALMFSSAGG